MPKCPIRKSYMPQCSIFDVPYYLQRNELSNTYSIGSPGSSLGADIDDCYLRTEINNIYGPYRARSSSRVQGLFCPLTYVLGGGPYSIRSNGGGSYYVRSTSNLNDARGYLISNNGIYGPYYLRLDN